nr:hypothetical protein [Tanacetum cinerariifolium]
MLHKRPQVDPPSKHVQNLKEFKVVSIYGECDQLKMYLEKENEWKVLDKNIVDNEEDEIIVEEELIVKKPKVNKVVIEEEVVNEKESLNTREVQVHSMQSYFQETNAYIPPSLKLNLSIIPYTHRYRLFANSAYRGMVENPIWIDSVRSIIRPYGFSP